MLGALTNLTKAAVSAALAPAALVVDVITLPASAEDPHRDPFERTSDVLDNVGECLTKALKPE